MPIGDCAAKITAKSIEDIRSGLGIFAKLGKLLMCTARIGSIKDTQAYIPPIKAPVNAQEFDKLFESNPEDFEEKHFTS